MNKFLLLSILILITPLSASTTEQESDILIYNNKRHLLFAAPLESYFKEISAPKLMIAPHKIRTSNWRGYIATWEITGQTLYLTDIDSYICPTQQGDCERATLQKIFGEKYINKKVQADWFTGELPIPDGKELKLKNVLGIVYEREIILQVKAGQIVGKKIIDNRKRYKST